MRRYPGFESKQLTIFALAAGVLALIVLAITLLSAEWSTESSPRMLFSLDFLGEAAPPGGDGIGFSPFAILIINGLILFLIVAVVLASISNPALALRAAILIALILLGARFLMSSLKQAPLPEAPFQEDAPLSEEVPEFGPPPDGVGILDPPAWFAPILIGAIVLVIGGGMGVFTWRYFRPKSDFAHTLPQQIAEDAQQALLDIESGYDLRSAILNAWLQMNNTLRKERGIVRQQAATAREFEIQLHGLGFPSDAVSRLTRLFEQVRYSPEEPGTRAQREAVDCLETIISSVGTSSSSRQAKEPLVRAVT